ncbi:hypothetical protein EDD86DRAFT_258023 [Gorgonomyces haynaldii]|nr:hypothetical protein EDD86DRAFT_258023 [Gorgonomyces haynaldii]
MQTSDMQVRSALLSSEQELKQSKKMIEWCNEELDRKNDHFQEYRREKQDQVAKLQTELETMTQDKTSLESRNQSLQKRTKELDERLQQSLQKAMDLENRLIVNEQHFRNEMNSQKKLTELYQSKSQELSKQLESFEHLTHDLEHQLLNMRESSQEEQQELLTELETLREKRQEQEQEIDRLKQELANVNQTLEQNNALDAIGTLSETAAAAGKLQKSGKTFTQQTRLDYERAKQENERLSTDLAVALHNRNESLEALKQLQREMSALEQEKTLVEQDCRDVKRQIQTLLVQMEQIAPSMSAQVDRSAFVVHEQDDLSPAEQLIQDRLVIFKNVEELQNQNLQLRRSLRSLAQQMESLEQQHRDEQAQTESILEAARLVHQLQEELKEKTLQLESFARERDQWKHIANARTKSPTKEKSETDPDYQMLYKDCQHEFEVYRKETTNDIDLLKKEAYALQQDKMNLSVQVAKVNNQLSYMEERYQLLSKTCDDQTNEMEQLRKRLSHVGPLTAKQDARIEELNNTLLSIRQDLEQQRNENQQLKIEQHVWKASEARALKEAQDLLRERNTSNERLRTMQQQLEDKERQHEQHLQKSEERLEQLTRELQLTRKQLSELMDDHRSLGSRRESELKESQIKIERLTSDHERAKGELLALESKEQLLQTRVQELQTRLQHAEDKLNVYEGRQLNLQSMGSSGNNQSRELDLALAQARIDLESTKQELQVQVEQVEQFKSISQASEERLIELNATYDLYKQEIEKEKQALEQKIANLEQESTQLKKDLQEALNEVFKTQEKLDSIAGEHAKQVSGLLAEKEQLKAGHDLAVKAKMDMKADMERQERLMKDAQESYEREVVAHSNALQAVNTLKQQVFETRQKIQESELKAQNAQQLLEKHKESSKTIQQKLEEQNHQLQIRVEDLVAQNNLIHAQFEQFSVARQPVVGEEKPLKDMQEVIKFLRREKEIVEAQLQLALHEQERQKVQTEHLQKSLDETRFLLEEERKRSSNGDLQEKHQELMERIEQANLLRESNVTLRVQLEESVQKLKTLEKRLLQAEGQVGPLKEQVLLLEAEVEARKQQAQQLQQDNERWKARSQQILQKYERIDPQEHQRLKQDVELLSNQKQELEKQLQERTAEHEKMMAELRKKNLNINEVAKKYKDSAQNKQQTIVSMKEQLDTKDLEIKQLKESTQVSSGLQQQLNAIREERDQQIAKYNLFAQKNKEKQQELEQQIQTLKTSMQQQGLEKDKLQQTHQQELDQAKKESEKHSARSNLLQAQLNKVRQENVRLQELTSDTSTKRARETDAAVEVQRAQSPKRQRVVEDKPKQVKKILQKQQKEAAYFN